MPEPTPRRSLAARRRSTKLFTFHDDDNDEKENSLNDTFAGRRQSRMFNASFNVDPVHEELVQTPTQLVDLYQKTVELATQGKINIKNAFNIPLVERLPQVLNVIALDDSENHLLGPNFVKAGAVIDTSAKIYGFRVDALHTETQKLSGNILNSEENGSTEATSNVENPTNENEDGFECDQIESKKAARRAKVKLTSFIANDVSKITLEHEFEFRPLQPPNMCQWRGGIGTDSIYAEMVSSTMYSSSDYPLIDGFTNANSAPEEQQSRIDDILDHTSKKMIDVSSLRDAMRNNEEHDHILGNQSLREFSFNESPSGSFIDTIHESCLGGINESVDQSYSNADENDHDDGYNHDELVHAAIDDLNDDPSHTNEVFKNALTELSQQDPSTMHSNLGNYQSQQSANMNLPFADDLLSSSFMSTISFAEQVPNLLHSKEVKSEYSYFDITKLKLFAGPNIWKYTNLLNSNAASARNVSVIQHQQAPATRHRMNSGGPSTNGAVVGPKRHVRVDTSRPMSTDQIMSATQIREKKAISVSQSAMILRVREKNFNQMQLARKLRPLTDLTNSHNFPELNFEHLHSRNRSIHEQQDIDHDHDDFDDHDFNDHLPQADDEDAPISAMQYDFTRPIHYEKIEFAKGSSSVNAKILKRQMIEEFTRQKVEQQRTLSLDTSTSSQQQQQVAVEFSILCEHLADHGHLSVQSDLASAFYCMLINCNENKLFMRNTSCRDDLFIQERPFLDRRELSTLSYSYTSSSNLSISSLSAH